jgi:predicted transcriptional regulator
MGRKRYRDQILAAILEVCAGGEANKTQIVYESGINFHTVVPYLELITRNELAERVEGGVPRYEATARGAKCSAFQGAEEMTQGRMLQPEVID